MYNAANSQQSNTYQYPTDKKVRKLFEVPTYIPLQHKSGTFLNMIHIKQVALNVHADMYISLHVKVPIVALF